MMHSGAATFPLYGSGVRTYIDALVASPSPPADGCSCFGNEEGDARGVESARDPPPVL